MSKTLANNKRGENMTTRKEKIANNDLSMEGIIEEFNTYDTPLDKAKFLREMGQLNLPYDVKWERLAQGYDGTRPFPVIKKVDLGDEDILSDRFDPVGETEGHGDPLTKQELDALL